MYSFVSLKSHLKLLSFRKQPESRIKEPLTRTEFSRYEARKSRHPRSIGIFFESGGPDRDK